jgi:FkbM family methyltransferase
MTGAFKASDPEPGALPILIYGAGGLGRQVFTQLATNGELPFAFIDRNAAALGAVEGAPVLTLEKAVDQYCEQQPLIIVAVHNFRTPVAEILQALKSSGFEQTISLWQFCQEQKWLPLDPYWLAPLHDWRSCQAAINKAYHLLKDPQSKKIFTQQLALRNEGNYMDLCEADFMGQYAPNELPPPKEPVRMIDCGAYDGDTIKAFLDKGIEIEQVFAFEPDPASFGKLHSFLSKNKLGTAINAGTFDHSGQLKFASLGTGASHLDATGDIAINIEKIDDVCKDFPVTFIKMDVEGAEAASLKGAIDSITKYRPTLALSIYHKPDDLWAVLLQVEELDLNYNYYIRSHGCNGFDTVLYATPR